MVSSPARLACMTSMYEGRLKNAQKIYNKLKDYLDKGYIIWNDEDERVYGLYEKTDEGVWSFGYTSIDGRCVFGLYEDHPEDDHGRFTPIREFNEKFKKWTIINPKNIKRLILR